MKMLNYNGLVLLTISQQVYISLYVFFLSVDCLDENGLNLEKNVASYFNFFLCILEKLPKTDNECVLHWRNELMFPPGAQRTISC